MRLSDFILNNIEPILVEWDAFARSMWPSAEVEPSDLRDHAAQILRAIVQNMESPQSRAQEKGKSQSMGNGTEETRAASSVHALDRVHSGVSMLLVVAEYQSLRTSVIRLWRASKPEPDLNDVDDRRRFNEALDRSLLGAVRSYSDEVERSRQVFLGILGHDLRNPLNAMMMSAQWLARTSQLSTESQRIVSQILASGAVVNRLIADLLDYTGISLGKTMSTSPIAMDLESLCQEVIAEVQAVNPTRTFRYDPRGDLTGEWDPERLRQVISNLLANAVQHGTGTIDFSADGKGSEVCLAIHNEGAPIPQALLPVIFDPLIRASLPKSGAPARKGSLGLGLYIAREIVSAHDGTIEVESTAEAGTTFTVRLPRRAPQPGSKTRVAKY